MTIERPEPAFGDEVAMLRRFLNHYRATIRRQASRLTDEELTRTLGPSDLTLGGMLKHLAFVEDYWFSYNEEYARHAGHADLIRQSIDGATDV